MILQDTVIFPEGGGQPSDTGFLKLADEARVQPTLSSFLWPSNFTKQPQTFPAHLYLLHLQIDVLDMHRNEAGEVVHVTDKPVEANQSVTASVDWDRRLDHMQQHTGQARSYLTGSLVLASITARLQSAQILAAAQLVRQQLGFPAVLCNSKTTQKGLCSVFTCDI